MAASSRTNVRRTAGLLLAGLALALDFGCSAFGADADADEAPVATDGGGTSPEAAGTEEADGGAVAPDGGKGRAADAAADVALSGDGAPADFDLLTFSPGSTDCARLVPFGGATLSQVDDGSCRVCTSATLPNFGAKLYLPSLESNSYSVSVKVRSAMNFEVPSAFGLGLRAEGTADPAPSPVQLSNQYMIVSSQAVGALPNARVVLVATVTAATGAHVCFEVDDLQKTSAK